MWPQRPSHVAHTIPVSPLRDPGSLWVAHVQVHGDGLQDDWMAHIGPDSVHSSPVVPELLGGVEGGGCAGLPLRPHSLCLKLEALDCRNEVLNGAPVR